jgi:hypothetical protein
VLAVTALLKATNAVLVRALSRKKPPAALIFFAYI